MSKTKNLILKFPSFYGAKEAPALKPLRSAVPLIPYKGTFYPNVCDPLYWDKAKKWFTMNEYNDILISTYPKCGHHLTQRICSEIILSNNNGKYVHDLYKLNDIGFNTAPLIEFYITASKQKEIEERIYLTNNNMYPRLWSTHLSFNNIPINNLNKSHKIIVMIRNPKDCIVSSMSFVNYYVNKLRYNGIRTKYTIDDIVSYFIRGIMSYGCYFKFYETYWNAMNINKYNILWLYYDEVIDNPLENIKKVANFIYDGNGDNEERTLNISNDGYNNIVKRISIESVRNDVRFNPGSFELGGVNFFRKGINNDWKEYFNDKQSERIDETMYFKWTQNCNQIKYYKQIIERFNDKCNKNYF